MDYREIEKNAIKMPKKPLFYKVPRILQGPINIKKLEVTK